MNQVRRVVRCPILVGRTAERDALTGAIARAVAGTPASVMVMGQAGVGKSRLVAEAMIATPYSPMVLTGRCVRTGRRVPYRAIVDALLPATRDLPAPGDPSLTPFVGVLGLLVPHWGRPGATPASPSEPASVVAEGVFRLLADLGDADGLVLVLEDMHWADEDTVEAAAYLVEHLAGSRVAVILTARDNEAGEPEGLRDVAALCDDAPTWSGPGGMRCRTKPATRSRWQPWPATTSTSMSSPPPPRWTGGR